MNLSVLDIALILAYLILIFFSGTIVKKYIKGIDNFLVAGRSMGFHLGLLSLMCTEIGMITYIYYAELGYKAGLAALIVAFPHKRKEIDINLLVLLFLRRKFNGIRKFDTTGSLL